MPELIQTGQKIEAIKRYRELTGVGLAEAKDAVERLEQGYPRSASGAPSDRSRIGDRRAGRGRRCSPSRPVRRRARRRSRKITIKRSSSSGASGKVISKRSGCEPHRKVTLFIYVDFVSSKVKITQSDSHGTLAGAPGPPARQVLRQGRRGQGWRAPAASTTLAEPAALSARRRQSAGG